MRVSLALAATALALSLAACGATNTAQTVPSGPSAGAPSATAAAPPPSPTAADSASATGTTADSTPAASVSTPETVTTATITAPDSGGAPNSGGGGLTGTATTASAPECTAADLSAAGVPPNSAPGTTVLGFILTNTSGSSCVSGAFPGIALVDSAGSVNPVGTTRVTRDALGATPVTRVSLGAGQTMSFRLTLHDSGADCGSYTGVQIIAPNDTATLKVTIPDGPVQSCGDVDVSPVEPGSSATGQ